MRTVGHFYHPRLFVRAASSRPITTVFIIDRRPIQNPLSRRPRLLRVTTTDLGTVVGASWSGVTIDWMMATHFNPAQRHGAVERVPVKFKRGPRKQI